MQGYLGRDFIEFFRTQIYEILEQFPNKYRTLPAKDFLHNTIIQQIWIISKFILWDRRYSKSLVCVLQTLPLP
jgi:hypothetical protein